MSAIARWAYSFFTTTEVKVDNVATRELYCGEKTLFCSIVLTDSKGKAAFTNYHRNEIKVFSEHGSVYNPKFELCINDDDQGRLDVYCVAATRAGRAQVKLDLGKWYTIVGRSEFSVVFRPSCPAVLKVIRCCGDRYVGGIVELQLASFDRYDNKAIACKHKISIAGNPPGVVSLLNSETSDGGYTIRLQFKVKCRVQVFIKVSLTGKRNNERDCPVVSLERCIKIFQMDISHPPMSSAKSFCRIISPSDHFPIAGSTVKIGLEINDVFGKPVHPELMPIISASQNNNKVLQNQIRVCFTRSHNKKLLEITETRAGPYLVHILLNDQIIPNWDFSVHVFASRPKYLRSLKAICHPKDSAFKPAGNTLYYRAWSTLEADITDEYENVAKQITDTGHFDVRLEALDNEGSRILLEWKSAKINNGKICVEVQPKQVGQQQLIIRLSDKRSPNEVVISLTTTINVRDSPCSSLLTQVKFNDTKCTAGSEYTFQVDIHDVFGNAVRPQSELRCDIDAHIQLPEFLKHLEKQRGEYIKTQKDSTSAALSFTVAVGLKLAGPRSVKVVVNSDVLHSKIISVEVVPSNPHHLNRVRFMAKTSEDPSFTPDPAVLYHNQWSTLEASIMDEYENAVTHFDGNERVRLKPAEQGNKTDVASKGAAIKDGVLRVKVKAKGVGQIDLLVILASKNHPNDEFLLEKVQVAICHPPMSSAQSFRRMFSPSKCPPKAGSPFMIEIEINDVFKEPVHPERMPSISASLNKVVQSRVCSTNSHNKKLLEITETRAGPHLVHILLNDQIIPNWDFNFHVVASRPKYLRSLKAICHPKDSAFKPAGNTLYYRAWSTLEADITDEYGNVAKQITDTGHFDVRLEALDNEGSRVLLEWKSAKINDGKICVEVQPQQVGQQQLIIRLSDKRNLNEVLISLPMTINVRDSPCSPLLTQVKFNDTKCTAGSEYTFQIDIHDVFGNAVRPQSELRCDIDAHIQLPEFLKHLEKQRGEYIKTQKDSTSTALSFTVAVGLKLAGPRSVKVVVNSDVLHSKIISVEVVPSNPHHLNRVRFMAKTSEDPSFTPDPAVLYHNQWSTLEASIMDEYENAVTHFDGNERVRLQSAEQGNKTDVASKGAAIKDGVLRVRVKAKGVGQRDLLVILTSKNRSNDEFLLEKVQVDICHPPMSSAQSFRRMFSPSKCPPKAGSPFMIEIEINDVFGEPVHPERMPSISASLNKVVQSRVRSTNSHNKKLLEITETRAGLHLVHILLNNQIIPNWDFNVYVVASLPKYLRSLKALYHPKDSAFKPTGNTLYYRAWSTLEADITDEYGNVAKQITDTGHYDVRLEAFDNKGSPVLLEWENAEINNGKICVEVQPKQVGQQQLIVRLSDKRNPNERLASVATTVSVRDSPCSALLTQVKFNDSKCTAGSEYTFQVDIHDVFGNAVRPQSELRCDIDAFILPQVLKYPEKQRGEFVKKERDSTSATLSFTVAVGLKLAGPRNVKVVVNSDAANSKILPVEVVPSNPHHLNKARFTAKTSEDPSFTPDPEVLYDNQWSTLEASIVDEFENVVTRFDGSENIRLKSAEQGKKTGVAYKDAAIKDGVLCVKVKAKGGGQRDLLVILASKNRTNDEVLLKKLQRPVIDAPFSLYLSKISQLDPCVAGTQFKFEVFPFDVYGKAMSADSTAKCILSGKVLDSPSRPKVNEECVIDGNVDKSSNYCIDVKVFLTKAGERRLEIFDKGNTSKQICIKVKPDLDNVKCKQTTNTVTSVYTGEVSRLSTVFTDRFSNKIPLDTARPPRLFQKSGPKQGLQTKSDATQVIANTCSVDYQFLKQGTYVFSLQCPNLRGDYTDVEEFSVDVHKAPLDPQQCTVSWSPEFDDLEDQPLFTEDEQFKCVVQLKDVYNNKYSIDDEESVDLSVTCGDKQATIQRKTILGLGALKATVPLINFQIHFGTTTEFCFILNGYKMVVPLRLTFVGYLNYDDSECQICSVHRGNDISTKTSAIVCKNVNEREIRGDDNCHLENIRRVCNLQDSDMPEVKQASCSTLLILPQSYPTNEQRRCRDTLLHLLKALHYRQQASEADKEREKWRDYAKENYDRLKSTNKRGEKPTFCRRIKERYASRMRKYNREACEEIFAFYNLQRNQNEIDLHGLLVTDEEKLKEHEVQLEMQGKAEDGVERIIEKEREEGDEAIRKLKQRMETFDMGKAKNDRKTWLEVIVGAGHHSKVRGRQMIRPKVEKYLEEETGGFSVVNKGALVVTFGDYRGTGRCFGEYYCQRCQNAWKSGRSWKGKYQGCHRCYRENKTIQKCYPLKQRPLEKGFRQKSEQTRYTTGLVHSAKFCEKCAELGYSCDRI